MRFSVLLPLVLALALALSASASLVLPLAATAASRITRRQGDGCTSECNESMEQTEACGVDMACLCTSSIAAGLQKCVQCQYEADPTSGQELLDQYARGCQTYEQVRSASLASASAITSTASQPSATGGVTGNGNGASSVAVQMTGAIVAAGVAAALAVL